MRTFEVTGHQEGSWLDLDSGAPASRLVHALAARFVCDASAMCMDATRLEQLFCEIFHSVGLAARGPVLWALRCGSGPQASGGVRYMTLACDPGVAPASEARFSRAFTEFARKTWLAAPSDSFEAHLLELGPPLGGDARYLWFTPQAKRGEAAQVHLRPGQPSTFKLLGVDEQAQLPSTSPAWPQEPHSAARAFWRSDYLVISECFPSQRSHWNDESKSVSRTAKRLFGGPGQPHVLALSAADVARYRGGPSPVLLAVPSLSPRDAILLTQIDALLLGIDGPSSHIAVMARSCGVPIAFHPDCRNPGTFAVAGVTAQSGDQVDFGLISGLDLGTGNPAARSAAAAPALPPAVETQIASRVRVATSRPTSSSVGLCRSEEHLFLSGHMRIVGDYVQAICQGGKPEIPADMATAVRDGFRGQLAAHSPEIHYRLLDLAMQDVLVDERGDPTKLSGLRGAQWCLAAGLYEWQLQQVRTVLQERPAKGLRLYVSAPSTFAASEIEACRALFLRSGLRQIPGVIAEFGVMIESPALCLSASKIARMAQFFAFGLNDLTQHCVGISRQDWPRVRDQYLMDGRLLDDPFSNLFAPVGDLVDSAIGTIASLNPEAMFTLCGTPAASDAALSRFAAREDLRFCAEPSSVEDVERRLSLILQGRALPPVSSAHAWTSQCIADAFVALKSAQPPFAREIALSWIRPYCADSFRDEMNWKVIKKRLLATLFGRETGVFLEPGWTIEAVDAEIASISTSATRRISVFPSVISCHSLSSPIPADYSRQWAEAFLADQSNDTHLHIFEQADENQLCFRAVFQATHIEIEAGWGQAMYVFEAERGKHPIATCTLAWSGEPLGGKVAGEARIDSALSMLYSTQADWLLSVGLCISSLLGTETFALEGYFDPSTLEIPVVVDIDLPLDFVWNVR